MTKRPVVILLPLFLLAALPACDNGGDAGTADTASASSDIGPATGGERGTNGDADLDEISDYRLSMDGVHRWVEAQRNLAELPQEGGDLESRLELSDNPSLDEMEDAYHSVPEVAEAIEDAGLDVRDFVVMTWTLFQAGAAQAVIDMGADPDSVIAEMGVSEENLEFVREHKAELEQIQAEIAAESGG